MRQGRHGRQSARRRPTRGDGGNLPADGPEAAIPRLGEAPTEHGPLGPPKGARPWVALVLATFVVLFTTLEVYSYRQKSATWDEPIHLTAGYLAAARGDYRVDPSHPPLLRMWAALPLLGMDGIRADTSIIDRTGDEKWLGDAYQFSTRFLYDAPDADLLLYSARFMALLWGVALGVLVFLWAREWLGMLPAVGALAFYTLEPNTAAHARLVTTDMAAACCIFATVYWLWRSQRQPTRGHLAGLTLSFALAFAIKFSAVLLLPIVGSLMVVAVSRGRLRWRRAAIVALVLAAAAYLAIWAVYGFRYAPSETDGWLLQLQHASIVREDAPALGNVLGWVDAQRVLPNAFTQGFLMSQASARQRSYLAGEYSADGFWYYFPAVFVLKTPTPLIVLILIGAAMLAVRRRQLGVENVLFVALPIVIYTTFAVASGINLGLRHLLPIYPFLLLIAAAAAQALAAWRGMTGRVALAALVAYWGVLYANVYPHPLTYMSEFAGGAANAVSYVADSNLDLGQDLKLLEAWMRNNEVERINLAYFGTADPDYYGIDGARLPGTPYARLTKPQLPGHVAISATILTGVYLEPHWRHFYSGFLGLQPVERIGNSIYVFHVDEWPAADNEPPGRVAMAEGVDTLLADALLVELEWPDQALHHYRAALERAPDDAASTEKLGLALLTTGSVQEAAAVLERAAALDPDEGRTRYRLALALLQIGEAERAIPHAAAATTLAPGDSAAHDLLGMALASTGRLAEADQAFRRAIELAPGNIEAREHLRQLQNAMASAPRSGR
jgi:tetratricopeptide (TPR) repeat protein